MLKHFFFVALFLFVAAPAIAQEEPPEAFVRVTAICDNADGTYNLRVRYEVDASNPNKPDSGEVEFNLQVGGTVHVAGETIESGESLFFDVPDGANGIRAVLLNGVTNTYGGTASNNRTPCVPPAAVNFAFNCVAPDEGDYYVWDGTQDVVRNTPNVTWFRVFNSGGSEATGVYLEQVAGGSGTYPVEDLIPGESVLVGVDAPVGTFKVVWDGGEKGTATSNANTVCTEVESIVVDPDPEETTTTTTTLPSTTTTQDEGIDTDVSGSGAEAETGDEVDDTDAAVDTLPFTGPGGDSGLLTVSAAALMLLGAAFVLSHQRRKGRHSA